jgi:hypothetical protein
MKRNFEEFAAVKKWGDDGNGKEPKSLMKGRGKADKMHGKCPFPRGNFKTAVHSLFPHK